MKTHNSADYVKTPNSLGVFPRYRFSGITFILKSFITIMFFACSLNAVAKEKDFWDYEVACAGYSADYDILEVTVVVSKKKDITDAVAKQCALHAVLFRGFQGVADYSSQPPIITNPKDSDSSYISELLSKDYSKYTVSAGTSLKVMELKKRYKVTTTVKVAKKLLRKDLENAGIIKKLGF